MGRWRTNLSLGAEKRRVERGLAGGVDCARLPEVDLLGCHQADACGVMVFVMPGCESAAERAGRVDGSEPSGELRPVFQGLEAGLRERVVVRGVRPAQGI